MTVIYVAGGRLWAPSGAPVWPSFALNTWQYQPPWSQVKERFMRQGKLCLPKRGRLHSDHVEQLIFLHNNF